jgi:hypothetical protein
MYILLLLLRLLSLLLLIILPLTFSSANGKLPTEAAGRDARASPTPADPHTIHPPQCIGPRHAALGRSRHRSLLESLVFRVKV